MRVLIVEDDPNLRLLWHAVFTERGAEVAEASTIGAAQTALRSGDFDLVLLDLYLGRENGLSLVEQVSRACPHARVVIVTGAAQDELPDTAGNIQFVLRKPVDIEDLLSVCDQVTGRKPASLSGFDDLTLRKS